MSKYHKLGLTIALIATLAAPAFAEKLGLGRPAMPEEVAAWNLDVRPDGAGLPDGQGTAANGEPIFEEYCASCHGSFAEGVDNWPKLAGGMGTLANKDPLKTVGSYWPYLSTTWDYVNRSMPFGNAQSLTPDDVYAIVAYILYSNDLIDDDFVLSKDTFLDVDMPNADGFILDDRAETEIAQFSQPPCMENCKDSVEITMRALVLDVTPDTGDDDAEAEPAIATATAEVAVVEAAVEPAGPDPVLVAEGEALFRQCKACHQVGDGAKNRTGPILNGVVDRAAAAVDGFRYSRPMQAAAEDGLIWDEAALAGFLADPKGYMKGTKMSFRGLKTPEDIAAMTAYLASFPE